MFYAPLVEQIKNDILILDWINSIHIHFIVTKKLNLDQYLLTVPHHYKRKITTLSYDFNISKVNLLPILIYNALEHNKYMYDPYFIKYISTLSKINSSIILSKKIV